MASFKTIAHNPTKQGMARMIPDVVFSTATGVSLKMQLLVPWNTEKRYPLIVFVQGSGFQSPDVYFELPQLARYAQAGYVVATVTHRNCKDGYPAPAYLQDVKTAVRFLRHNAKEYSIDPARVCAFGTSSGGNTVLLLGMTGDDPALKTDEYKEQSDAVTCVVECFGPVDMTWINEETVKEDAEFLGSIIGRQCKDFAAVTRQISPYALLNKDTPCPPTMILHGDKDDMVPYEGGYDLYQKMAELGKDVEMICVKDAPHEGSFWSQPLNDEILDFIGRKL